MNHAISAPTRVHMPQPTMLEVFQRLGFRFEGYPQGWRPDVWATGWGTESDVLTRKERQALGFKP